RARDPGELRPRAQAVRGNGWAAGRGDGLSRGDPGHGDRGARQRAQRERGRAGVRGAGRCSAAMSLEDPVVITCSISGTLANREQCAAIPYTPAEYAAEARRIVDEGGTMIHIHARKEDGTPPYEVEDFRAITVAIKDEVVDEVIINYSTGAIGLPIEKRLEYLRELRPEVAALHMR